MRLLAAEARAAGRDPASDPVPGLRRDVLFASTADEEAGGLAGVAWLALEHPEALRAAAAINEAGARRGPRGRAPPLPDPGRREGHDRLPAHLPRDVGPRLDAPRQTTRSVLAAEAITRLVGAVADAADAESHRPSRPGDRGDRRRGPSPAARGARAAPNVRRTRRSPGMCPPIHARALDAHAPRHALAERRCTAA